MQRGLRVSTIVVAATILLAACGSGPTGNPSDSSTAAPSPTGGQSSAAGSTGEAPRVLSPLPTGELIANPCGALSASQLNQLGIAPGGQASTNQAGPTCKWTGAANPSNTAAVGVMTANHNGLSDIYTGNDQKRFAYFEPTQVDGYPGVYAESTNDRANGFCTVWIGITDQLAIGVSMILTTGSNKTHPCDSANAVGKAVIEHLKGAA